MWDEVLFRVRLRLVAEVAEVPACPDRHTLLCCGCARQNRILIASAASAGVGKYRKFVEPHKHWGSRILEPRIVDFGLETVAEF